MTPMATSGDVEPTITPTGKVGVSVAVALPSGPRVPFTHDGVRVSPTKVEGPITRPASVGAQKLAWEGEAIGFPASSIICTLKVSVAQPSSGSVVPGPTREMARWSGAENGSETHPSDKGAPVIDPHTRRISPTLSVTLNAAAP